MNIQKKLPRRFTKIAGETVAVLSVTILLYFVVSMVSCKITSDGIEMLYGDFTAPELRAFSVESVNKMRISFSEDVASVDLHVTDAETNTVYATATRVDVGADKKIVSLELSKATLLGGKYRLTGVIGDTSGNTLSFSLLFAGYNQTIPQLILSEVRSEYSKPKAEFIELYAITAGNLSGVTLYSAYDGVDCVYEFPNVQVKAGEYIVVHYRKLEEGSVDEIGTNLSLSAGTDSSAARDFWVNNTAARIGKSDVILLRERAGGKLIDALLYSESSKTEWKTTEMREAAEEAVQAGLWDSALPANVLCSDSVTPTRTIGRQNIPSTSRKGKAAWLVTTGSSASPGKANSSVPYVK